MGYLVFHNILENSNHKPQYTDHVAQILAWKSANLITDIHVAVEIYGIGCPMYLRKVTNMVNNSKMFASSPAGLRS